MSILPFKEPLVINFLKTHTFEDLEEMHGVRARPCGEFRKFSLNYDQLKVKNDDPLACECRGLIVRPDWNYGEDINEDNYKTYAIGHCDVVAWPMDRFFNDGDHHAASVDWADPELKVFEKLDGTMCLVYWDNVKDEWHIATRNIAEANLPIMNNGVSVDHTFASLFKAALARTHVELFDSGEDEFTDEQIFEMWAKGNLNEEYTYVFELTTPLNQVVIRYDDYRVTLLAVRHTSSGKELPFNRIEGEFIKCPSWSSFNEPKALAAFVNASDPSKLEGAVAMDSQYRRVKVKNQQWVLSSRAKATVTVSRRNAVRSILEGTIDDIIPLLGPEIVEALEEMREKVVEYISKTENNFCDWSEQAGDDRKFFAELVMRSQEWATPYFHMKDRKAETMFDWFQNFKWSDKTLDLILNKIKD